jgi:hypothetical protein
MTELVYSSNIDFLLPKGKSKMDYKFSILFAAGEVYISAIIDTLTCQAFYNQHIVTILQQLLQGSTSSENPQLEQQLKNEFSELTQSNLW